MHLVGVPTEIYGQPTVFTSSSFSDSVYVDLSTVRLLDWDKAKADFLAGETKFSDGVYPYIQVEVVNKTKHTIYYVIPFSLVMDRHGTILGSAGSAWPAYGSAVALNKYGEQEKAIPPGGRGLSRQPARWFDLFVYNDASQIHFTITYETAVPAIQGDIDRDGDVDFDDFFILADNFGKTAEVAE